jgi:hypothetical protein
VRNRRAILVDVLRRAGRFDRAAAVCDAALGDPDAEDILRRVMEYQRRLIAAGDDRVHSVAAAAP